MPKHLLQRDNVTVLKRTSTPPGKNMHKNISRNYKNKKAGKCCSAELQPVLLTGMSMTNSMQGAVFIYYTGVLHWGLHHAVTSRELTEGTHRDPRHVFLTFLIVHIKHVLLNHENKSQGRILQLCVYIYCIYFSLFLFVWGWIQVWMNHIALPRQCWPATFKGALFSTTMHSSVGVQFKLYFTLKKFVKSSGWEPELIRNI